MTLRRFALLLAAAGFALISVAPCRAAQAHKVYEKLPFDAKEAKRRQDKTAQALGISAVWDLRSASRKSHPAKRPSAAGGFRLVFRTLKPLAAPKPKPEADVKPEDAKPVLKKAGHKIYAKWPFDANDAKRRQAVSVL